MKQGEIWLISLDPTIGSEIRKTRPAIIVNDNQLGKLPLKIIVPLTDWKDRYAIATWMVKIDSDTINNLSKTSATDCFQVRCVAEERFIKCIGNVTDKQLAEIQLAFTKVLSIRI